MSGSWKLCQQVEDCQLIEDYVSSTEFWQFCFYNSFYLWNVKMYITYEISCFIGYIYMYIILLLIFNFIYSLYTIILHILIKFIFVFFNLHKIKIFMVANTIKIFFFAVIYILLSIFPICFDLFSSTSLLCNMNCIFSE